MWSGPRLPYHRDQRSLPSPLPSREEIESSTNTLGRRSAQTVVKVGEHYIVKYGTGTSQLEGENLLFIEQNLEISAPKLYAMYWEDSKLYLVMEFISGDTLLRIWPTLLQQDKKTIMQKLRTDLDQMRKLIPYSTGFYGSVVGGPVPYHLFWTRERDPSISGPFDNEHELNMALVRKMRSVRRVNNEPSYKADFMEKHMPTVLYSHEPTFTHSDLQRKNILIAMTKDQEPNVTIVDWEDAGWYPEYWEYFASFKAFEWDDDWSSMVEACLDPWPAESAFMNIVYAELFF